MQIKLPNGDVCLIDDEDAWIVEKFSLAKTRDYVSCQRSIPTEYGHAVERIYLHRLVMGLKPNSKWQVDHINRNPLDNRRCNLRRATSIQNAANSVKKTRGKSGFRGVIKRKDKLAKPWMAYCGPMSKSGKHQHLGYYATAEEAAHAYDRAAIQRYGEFAVLNFEGNRP